ncbi:hypothetical protein QZH45_15865 [Pseudomonas corrugata]|uniref:hypothetical protein n=1 Tax=Pseudomonas corrugata TaxID=47879 RepID=UPI003D817AC5
MIVKAEVTLVHMIQNKGIFFDLIDHMDKTGEGDEVRTVMYQQKLRGLLDAIAPLPEARFVREMPAERRKLEAALSVENLLRSGLVTQVDNARGVMVFAPFVIEMFRHFDSARLRHLSSADYEVIRRTLTDLYIAFGKLPSLDPHDVDFKEHVKTLQYEIRRATSKMQECVASLQGCVQRLSEIVEQADYTEVDEVRKAQDALSEINTIYMRNILPALQFLDEEPDIKGGISALAALIRIGELLDGNDHANLVTSIYYAVESIRSYRHDISIISASLMRYVQQSEAHRLAYDRIERAWNRLYGAVREMQDGSLKDNTLPCTHPALASIKTFLGIKVRYFEAKVHWPKENHRIIFGEHLRTALPHVSISAGVIHEVVAPATHIGHAKRLSDARLLTIGALVDSWVARTTVNVHLELHAHLLKHLDDYELTDLLVSLEWLKKREGLTITPLFQMSLLESGCQRLRYYNLHVEATTDA